MERMNWDKFEKGVKSLVKQISNSGYYFNGIYGVARGGLPLAVRLSHLLNLPLINHSHTITRKTLITDDLVDSGKTLEGFKGFKICTLYYKPQSIVKPDFYAFTTTRWVCFPWEMKIK